jgi:hypothetical protein
MERIMRKQLLLIVIFLVVLLPAGVAGNAGTDFRQVQIRTKPLTMTGMRQAPPAEEPRDYHYQFTPVQIKIRTLTMTGMRD